MNGRNFASIIQGTIFPQFMAFGTLFHTRSGANAVTTIRKHFGCLNSRRTHVKNQLAKTVIRRVADEIIFSG